MDNTHVHSDNSYNKYNTDVDLGLLAFFSLLEGQHFRLEKFKFFRESKLFRL